LPVLRCKDDIAYNPVFFAYAFITTNSSTLYVDPNQLSSPIQSYLSDLSVNVKPYDAIATDLQSYSAAYAATADAPLKVLISAQGSWALAEAIGADKFEIVPSPVTLAKAVKNEAELEGFRQCHVRDGAALVGCFCLCVGC
jgi:Xaa-Pro aminopeptidase